MALRQPHSDTLKQIGTHNGAFHCDEALACYMLQRTKSYANANIVRTRDPELLKTMDVVVDVGGEYDIERGRFDHHQRGFNEMLKEKGRFSRIKLSSAGLVYKHFGKEVLRRVIADRGSGKQLEDDVLDIVYKKIYEAFVEGIDGIDNGVERFEGVGEPRYEIATDLSSRVARLNTRWNEEATEEKQYMKFREAMMLAGSEFEQCVMDIVDSWLPAREIVQMAMFDRFEREENGRILVMKEYAPWKDHIYRLEQEETLDGKQPIKEVYYVVYKDITGKTWRVQAVPVSKGSFLSRKALPASWRGVRDSDLSTIADIEGCVFCHPSGFIAGNITLDGAIQMALAALAASTES